VTEEPRLSLLEPVPVTVTDHLLSLLVSEQTRTREATEQIVSLFSEAVTTINTLAEKADGLFSGDAPALGGPAGMILGALIPRKRG
jgi:hypothetical protein